MLPSPGSPELQQLFSVSFAPQAAAGAAVARTESGQAATSAGPAAPSGEQAASLVHVVAAAEPEGFGWTEGTGRSTHGPKQEQQNSM